jgi:hypothetical protein
MVPKSIRNDPPEPADPVKKHMSLRQDFHDLRHHDKSYQPEESRVTTDIEASVSFALIGHGLHLLKIFG